MVGINAARKIAEGFVEQYHTFIRVENTILLDEIWLVDVLASYPNTRKFELKIDAKTGVVLEWKKIPLLEKSDNRDIIL